MPSSNSAPSPATLTPGSTSTMKHSESSGALSASGGSNKSETVSYLILYENMVRQQDLEFDATADHLKHTIERIRVLGRRSKNRSENEEEKARPKGMITFLEMRRCLMRLGYTWNRSFPLDHPAMQQYYDDDISVHSVTSSSTYVSGGASAGSGLSQARDIIATDAQLIMLLTTLVEMEEKYRAGRLSRRGGESDSESEEDGEILRGLFLPEFIQAYKVIIGGMHALQTIPNPTQGGLGVPSLQEGKKKAKLAPKLLDALRTRSRERTLGLLRLFGPDARLYLERAAISNQAAGEVPSTSSRNRDPLSHSNKDRSSAPRSTNATSSRPGKSAKDGLQPRLSEDEIRKLVHSKDQALAKILEEHETEMNVMASNMEELREKDRRTQASLRARRKRNAIIVLVMIVLMAMGWVVMEFRRREQVAREISLGKEEQRKEDAATIAKLEGEVKDLKLKLSDAEAAIRFAESRLEKMKVAEKEARTASQETEVRWRMDRSELDRCLLTTKELNIDLADAMKKTSEKEEEISWCRKRLQSKEREVGALERALEESRKKGVVDVTVADVHKQIVDEEIDIGDNSTNADGDDEGGKKSSALKLEMKYNKSFRKAVMARQTYSAIGGVAASALLQLMAPGVGQVLLRFCWWM